MGQTRRTRISYGLGILAVLLLVLGGVGLVMPGKVEAASGDFTCTDGAFDAATFQGYLNGAGAQYIGTTPCMLTLTSALQIGSGAGGTKTIDGGGLLTIVGDATTGLF